MMFVEFWTVVSKGFKQLFYWTGNHCCKSYHTNGEDKRKCPPATTMRRHHDHDCFIAHNPHCLFAVGLFFIQTSPLFSSELSSRTSTCGIHPTCRLWSVLRFVVYTCPPSFHSVSRLPIHLYLHLSSRLDSQTRAACMHRLSGSLSSV